MGSDQEPTPEQEELLDAALGRLAARFEAATAEARARVEELHEEQRVGEIALLEAVWLL